VDECKPLPERPALRPGPRPPRAALRGVGLRAAGLRGVERAHDVDAVLRRPVVAQYLVQHPPPGTHAYSPTVCSYCTGVPMDAANVAV